MANVVRIYENPDYQGRNAGLQYGEYAAVDKSTGVANDKVSSLKVAAFTKAVFYQGKNFTDSSITIIGPMSIPHLKNYKGGMNDNVSSIKITRIEPSGDTKAKCCAKLLPEQQCGEFWGSSPTCDIAVSEYCRTRTSDAVCTCINSTLIDPKFGIHPKCIDKKCLETGYQTTGMKSTACPAIVDCKIQNQLVNSGIVLSNIIPVQQNCGTGATSSVIGDASIMDQLLSTQTIFIFIFLVIIFGTLFLMYKRYKNRNAGVVQDTIPDSEPDMEVETPKV